ncbi:MAG: hypothetical protein K6G30_09210 [Acetatifactor sp.]|nr:hypothetical protein [Acetatifactor sp.]
MEEQMKKIGRQMGIRMGLLMSFCLALVGTLTSGHFTPIGFLLSFVISSVISILIGFLIPVGKVSGSICKRLKLEPGKLATRCVESLISDIIYTPVITLAMVAFAYNMAMKQSGGMAEISFLPMFLHSLLICFVVGYVLIFIFMPMFLKQLMQKK